MTQPIDAGVAPVQAWPSAEPSGADVLTTQDVQATAEGVDLDDTNSIEFLGERFRLAESIGLMPLLKFAHTAKGGATSDDMEGLDAMYVLIRSCIDRSQTQQVDDDGKPVFDPAGAPVWAGPSQWELFEQHAIATNADGEDLSAVINQAVQVISARPTRRRGDSSPSSPPTSPSSKGSSSSPGTRPVPPGFEDLVPVAELGR
jgi:hypothetical protein